MPIEHSICEMALIVAAISPCVKTFSVLFALLEHACVFRVIGVPFFDPMSVLAVIDPVSFKGVTIQV